MGKFLKKLAKLILSKYFICSQLNLTFLDNVLKCLSKKFTKPVLQMVFQYAVQ